MKSLVAAINLGIIAFIIYRHWKSYRESSIVAYYWPALMAKILAGILLGLIYMFYYQIDADTFLFFEDSKKMTALARTDLFSYLRFMMVDDESHPLWSEIVYQQSRALFMVKLTSVVGLLTYDNYWINAVYFSLLSFVAAWRLTNVITLSFPATRLAAIISFLYFPSVVFWSSGLIKESIAMAAIFFLTSVVVRIWTGSRMQWWEWILVILSAWIEWRLKYYYLAVFLPVAVAALVTGRLSDTWRLTSGPVRILLWSATFILPLVILSSMRPNFYPTRILEVIVSNNREFNAISDAGDFIEYRNLEPTLPSVIGNAPKAIVSGMFRPFPWEAHTLFQWWIAAENLIVLALALTSVGNVKYLVKSRQSLLLCSVVLYVLALCVFLALSTPNFGTLSRYRISFLPFFVFLVTIENPLVKKLKASLQRS